MVDLKSRIRDIPDFPKKGILFRDITTLLKDEAAFARVIEKLTAYYEDEEVERVVGIESRGFILGAPLAYTLGAGFIPVRKPGKLPSDIFEAKYELEYGTDTLTIHQDAITPGQRVLVVDDLLATGGTMAATLDLLKQLGAVVVGVAVLIELAELKGREKLAGHQVLSLISY
ncbi:MAG TPA: adenine phosphoribosyltransferase [Nitrospirota bacterium]|nr:adenine phosphoribosyltransferase [Nitrospirota bacterium]